MDGGGGSRVTAGGREGGRDCPRGKQAPLQQEPTAAADPCDGVIVANNFTFMVNDKTGHVTGELNNIALQ